MADTFTVPPDASSTSDSSLDQGTLISDVSPITSSPQKPSAPSPTVVIARPTQNRDFSQSIPKDALNRAYHTLDFYQRNPNWLADPDTMHAAQLDLANSSKLIEMSIQLERVGNQAGAVRLTNRLVQDNVKFADEILSEMPEAKLSDGTPVSALAQPDRNGVTGLSDTSIHGELAQLRGQALQKKATRLGELKVAGQIDLAEARHDFTLENIQARTEAAKDLLTEKFQNQLDLIDPKNEAAKDRLRERYKLAKQLFEEELPQKTQAAKDLITTKTAASKELIGARGEIQKQLAALRTPKPGESAEVKALRGEHATIQKAFDLAKAKFYSAKGTTDEKSAQGAYNALYVALKDKEEQLDAAIAKQPTAPKPSPTQPGTPSTNEVQRVTASGRTAIFDATTKKFLRYAE